MQKNRFDGLTAQLDVSSAIAECWHQGADKKKKFAFADLFLVVVSEWLLLLSLASLFFFDMYI